MMRQWLSMGVQPRAGGSATTGHNWSAFAFISVTSARSAARETEGLNLQVFQASKSAWRSSGASGGGEAGSGDGISTARTSDGPTLPHSHQPPLVLMFAQT